jgi:hypothetical protein
LINVVSTILDGASVDSQEHPQHQSISELTSWIIQRKGVAVEDMNSAEYSFGRSCAT